MRLRTFTLLAFISLANLSSGASVGHSLKSGRLVRNLFGGVVVSKLERLNLGNNIYFDAPFYFSIAPPVGQKEMQKTPCCIKKIIVKNVANRTTEIPFSEESSEVIV